MGRVQRRYFLIAAGALLAAPLAADAQQAGKVPHIGVLALADIPYANEALQQGLREQGYIEGQNSITKIGHDFALAPKRFW